MSPTYQDSLPLDAVNMSLPVFDGGIAVYRDNFVIQYKDSAEFVKIENKGTVMETVTKTKLWDLAEPELNLSFKLRPKSKSIAAKDDHEFMDDDEKKTDETPVGPALSENDLVKAA